MRVFNILEREKYLQKSRHKGYILEEKNLKKFGQNSEGSPKKILLHIMDTSEPPAIFLTFS